MLTDTQTLNMRNVLHQIYVNLYIEFGKKIGQGFYLILTILDSRQEPPIPS